MPHPLWHKERARSLSRITGVLVPGHGNILSRPLAQRPCLDYATHTVELSFAFMAKMEKCGINLPCSMVLTSFRF